MNKPIITSEIDGERIMIEKNAREELLEAIEAVEETICSNCDGTGNVSASVDPESDGYNVPVPCPYCKRSFYENDDGDESDNLKER